MMNRQRGFIVNPFVFGGAGAPTDPDFSSVVVLLHMDGTHGSSTFTDVTGRTWGGGAGAISTTQSKFGGASGDMNINPIDSADSADFDLTGAFTIEYWERPNNVTTFMGVIGNRDGGGDGWEVYVNNSGSDMYFQVNGAFVGPVANGVRVATTWQHVAISGNSGSTVNIYIDGINRASGTVTVTTVTSSMYIGRRPTGGSPYNGYIDDVRITKGVARYTGNTLNTTYFTPPSAAFPDS